MFGGMKNKLQEMQQKMAEIKDRLGNITVIGESAEGRIKVTANGNRQITNIAISGDDSFKQDPQFAEQLRLATNRALDQAEKVSEAEMQGAAKGMLPNIPGMF